jgi:4-amino-4-deoxy-L-arabinose transferase-like glycosyltransferase
MAVRLANWTFWWIGLFITYKLGKRAFDRPTAVVAIVLLTLNWVWMLNARRVMMDVPSSVWMLLTIYLISTYEKSYAHCIAIVLAAGMSTATKFQMGPLAVFLVLIFSIDLIKKKDWAYLSTTLITGIIFTIAFGFVDRIIYGQWFDSLLNFYTYTFVHTEEFATTYGACEPSTFYFIGSTDIFSYVFPFFIALGMAGAFLNFKGNKTRVIFLASIISYLALIQNVCHKQIRYLVAILPLLTVVGAYGIIRTTAFFQKRFSFLQKSAVLSVSGMCALVCLIAFSFVPRGDVKGITALKESCASFVYDSVQPDLLKSGIYEVMLAVPCGMPSHFLRPIKPIYGGVGFNEQSRNKELREYRERLEQVSAVVVEKGSLLETILLQDWKGTAMLGQISNSKQYVLYKNGKSLIK